MNLKLPLLDDETSSRGDDWTFNKAATRDLTHCYHDYPARMIPQVARRLLSTFGENAQTLFDPYCGTGTSLVEGRVRGLSVVGTDLNPLARLIASAKTDALSLDVLDAALSRFELFVAEPNVANLSPDVPEGIGRLEFWFKPEVIADLARLRGFLPTIEQEPVRRFFEVAFSETVRDCSNTRPNEFKLYRRAAEDLPDFAPNVFRTMQAKLTRNRAGLVDFLCKLQSQPVSPSPARVFGFNTVEGIPLEANLPPESVDIVLTSPPYGDSGTTVAYGQYSRLSSEWLGLPDPASVDRRLMGGGSGKNAAMPVFASDVLNDAIKRVANEDEKRAGEVGAFYRDLEASIEHVAGLLRPSGYACYVVGNRRVKGVALPTDDAVRRAFEQHGFNWHDTFFRTIPNKRMPLKNSPSNIAGASDATMTREYIVVMRRRS